MNEIKISVDVLNAILAYLGARPYQEVNSLIKAVQDAAKEQLEAPTPPIE